MADSPVSKLVVNGFQYTSIYSSLVLLPLNGAFIAAGIVLAVAPPVFTADTPLHPLAL
jgi:hypothetical protein